MDIQKLWKITDFGLTSEGTSKVLHTTTSARGTNGYRAPEMIRDSKKGFSNKADVWAVGCIFYELLVGEQLFVDDWSVFNYLHSNTPISIPQQAIDRFGAHWVGRLSDFLQGMLSADPQSRLGISQVLRQCAFHYEFALIDHPTVYQSYRLQGCAYWDMPKLVGWDVLGVYDSSYIRCTFNKEQFILDVANGFSIIHRPPNLNRDCMDNIWKRRSTGHHLFAGHLGVRLYLTELETRSERFEDLTGALRLRYFTEISAKALSYDGDRICWGTTKGEVHMLDLSSSYLRSDWPIALCDGEVRHLGFHRRDKSLLYRSTFKNGKTTFAVWRWYNVIPNPNAREFERETTFTSWISGDLFHPVLHHILFCPNDRRLEVRDIFGEQYWEGIHFDSRIVTVAYSPCGGYILSSHMYIFEGVHIFDATNLRRLHTIEDIGGPLWFCDERNELCLVGPDGLKRLHLINFKAERRRVGFEHLHGIAVPQINLS